MSGPVEENQSASSDGRAKRWASHKEQRRSDVVEAALQVIEEDGPDIGVQQVADRAGLPRPVVYRHFKDRDDLDRQIMQRAVDRLMAELRPTLQPTGTSIESVRRAVHTYVRWIDEHPNLHRFIAIRSNPARSSHSGVVVGTGNEIAAQVSGVFTNLLRPLGVDPDITDSVAYGLVGLVDSTVNRWLSNPDSQLSSERFVEHLTAAVWSVIDGALQAEGVTLDPDDTLTLHPG